MTPTPITRARPVGAPKLQRKLVPPIMQPTQVVKMRSAGTPTVLAGKIYVPPACRLRPEVSYQHADNFVRNMVTVRW